MQENDRLGIEKINNQGCLMKIIEYKNSKNIIVEFQDLHKFKVHTNWYSFDNGHTKNPYAPSVHNVGCVGAKYKPTNNGDNTKEYNLWKDMLDRCYKKRFSTYKDVTCCKEWLLYENFYEWLHNQENFDKWLLNNNVRWNLEKDILVKGNKMYSPETCCLVPQRVNALFIKSNKIRGVLPIGVTKNGKGFAASLYENNKRNHIGTYNTPEEAFQAYKTAKEKYIKQVAQDEYNKGNITKPCYEAMMKYKVEITD